MKKIALLILAAIVCCGVVKAQEKLNVLASASMFADMAANIGGDKVVTASIVPIGGDPHLYDPSPSDVQRVLEADVILVNGLTFEGWIAKLIKNSGTKALVRTITEGIPAIESSDYDNASDPHAWMSAHNGLTYVDNILDALTTADPANSNLYTENHAVYRDAIAETDEYIKKAILNIPRSKRVLITSHDAFAYYGVAYGMQLNAIKGISTEEETQTSDILRVSEVIKKSGVPAIFIESTINPKTIKRIATDNGVKIGGELYADSLGPKGSKGDSYLKMLRYNTDVIVNALSQGVFAETKVDTEHKESAGWVYLLLGASMFAILGFLATRFKSSGSTDNIDVTSRDINVKGVSLSYGTKRVLTNIHLNIEGGNVYGVIGPNGAGKSTLFKAILGLTEESTGSIKVMGQDIEDVRNVVAYVPQKEDVDWTFPAKVIDVVMMGRYPHKNLLEKFSAEDKSKATQALADLGIADLRDRQIGQLSGGQQQRVFIARALCQEAEIFLLDEPFVGVDILTEEKIISILKKLAERGKTLLVVHHDLSTVSEYFNKVILLNQRLIAYGDTETTFTDENIKIAYGGQLSILHKTGLIG